MAGKDVELPDLPIEIITPILDNGMFLVAVVSGVIVGGIALYALQEFRRQQDEKIIQAVRAATEIQLDPTDNRPEEIPVEAGWMSR